MTMLVVEMPQSLLPQGWAIDRASYYTGGSFTLSFEGREVIGIEGMDGRADIELKRSMSEDYAEKVVAFMAEFSSRAVTLHEQNMQARKEGEQALARVKEEAFLTSLSNSIEGF